jgi:glutaminyl-tRNA synthetase
MAVLDPVKVVLENYPEGRVEWFDLPYFPAEAGGPPEGCSGPPSRRVPFSRELLIERADFLESPPKKFFRLSPGREVRLRYAYYITCREVVRNDNGDIVELRCVYDPDSKGGDSPDGRKVKGTLHWVDAVRSVPGEARLYDALFLFDTPDDVPEGGSFLDNINPNSLRIARARLEPDLAGCVPGTVVQFERLGYFCADRDGTTEHPVFSRTVTLKDSWTRSAHREG